MRKYLLLIFLALFSFSAIHAEITWTLKRGNEAGGTCIGDYAVVAAYNNESEDVVNEISLTGKRIQIPNEQIDKYPEIIINNILISQMYTYYGSVLTQHGWNESDTLFCLGNGHNEFLCPEIAKGTDKSLMILDKPSIGNALKSLTIIKTTDNIKAIKETSKWKKYDLSDVTAFRTTCSSFVQLSNSSILVAGGPFNDIKHLFSIIDYKKQKATPLKYWPDDGVKCEDLVKHSVYTDNSRLYGNGNGHFLYLCKWSRFAFVFTIDGKNIDIIKYLFSDYPHYTSDEQGLNYVFKQKTASPERLCCATSCDRIYFLLLDSDCKGRKFDKYETSTIYGNTIVEYDWDGNKQRIIHLDHYGQNILLSEDNKTLYLLTNDYYDYQVPEIWSYDLGSIK